MKPDRDCTTCRSFCRAESETNEAADYGECRLFPPVVVVVDDEPMSLYPQVDDKCACSQWESGN